MTTSREPRELLVVRLPLLDVRVPTLLRLFAEVIEERRVAAEVEEADLAVAVGVHRSLQEAQRHRREREHLAAPLERLRLELGQRNDRVDEPHVERLLRVILTAEEPDLARLLLSDDAGEIRRAEARVEGADARSRLE